MGHTSLEDIDHDGANVAPANLDKHGATVRGEGVEPSEEDMLAEIDRYMVDLLNRTGQRSVSDAAPLPAAVPKPVRNRRSGEERRLPNDQRGAEEGQTAAAAAGASSQDKSSDKPPKPRRTAPAQRDPNLSAMREVARDSAQNAIAVHDSKQFANRARGKLSVAIVATCTAVLLFWMAPSHSASTFPTALLAVVIAGTWGAQSLSLFLQSRRLVRTEPQVEAS